MGRFQPKVAFHVSGPNSSRWQLPSVLPSSQETTGQVTKHLRASVYPTSLQKSFYCWDLKERVVGEHSEPIEAI